MNELQIFNYNNKQFRIVDENGEFWFIAKDVCNILGLKQVTRALQGLKKNDSRLLKVTHPQNPNKKLEVNAVSEPGLYKLIFKSRKPEAEQFQDWVFYKVLPDIRKHGMYISDKLAEQAKVDKEAFDTVVNNYLAEKKKTQELQEYIEKNRAYTLLGEIVTSLEGSVPIADASTMCVQHGYDIGRNRLYKLLRELNLVCSQKSRRNKPTQKGVEQGIVNLELDSSGNYTFTTRTMVTPKGMRSILDLLQAKQRPLEALWQKAD